MLTINQLPTSNGVNSLKQLNAKYFQNNGKWLDGWRNNETTPFGVELYVTIEILYPYKTYKTSLYFNEYDTVKERTEELNQFFRLTRKYQYRVI